MEPNTSNIAASARHVSPTQSDGVKRERLDDEKETTRRVSQRTNEKDSGEAAGACEATMDELVLEIMEREDEDVLKETMEKIRALLYNEKDDKISEEAQNDFFQLGGHLALVCVMKKHLQCLEIQKIGISIFLSECRGEIDVIGQAIGRVGGMQAILGAMKNHPNDDHIVYYAIKALYNLICLEANAEMFVSSTDGVSVILESMKTFAGDGETLYEACDLLHSLCEYEQLRNELDNAKVGTSLMVAYEDNKDNDEIRKMAKDAIVLLFE